jgi:hypothetical protein
LSTYSLPFFHIYRMNLKKISALFYCLFAVMSCVDDLDFTQLENYKATPIYLIAAVHFTVFPFQFFEQSGNQMNEIREITDFNLFENDYIKNKIVKLEFNAEVLNEYDNDFILEVQLLNANYLPIFKFEKMSVSANDLAYQFKQTETLISNPSLINMRGLSITIKTNNPSLVLNPNDSTELQFKSFIKVYLDTDA